MRKASWEELYMLAILHSRQYTLLEHLALPSPQYWAKLNSSGNASHSVYQWWWWGGGGVVGDRGDKGNCSIKHAEDLSTGVECNPSFLAKLKNFVWIGHLIFFLWNNRQNRSKFYPSKNILTVFDSQTPLLLIHTTKRPRFKTTTDR